MEEPMVIPINRNKKYAVVIPPDSDLDPEGVAAELSQWMNNDELPFLILTSGVTLKKVDRDEEN